MLSDQDLTRLLGEAAASYDVPTDGSAYVLEERSESAPGKPRLRRRGVQLTAAAALVLVAAVLAQSSGSSPSLKQETTSAGDSVGFTGASGGGGTTDGTGGELSQSADSGVALSAPAPLPSPLLRERYKASAGSATATTPQGGTAAPVDDGAESRVVKTGALSLVVDDGKVTTTVTKVTAVAKAARGYVSDSTTQEFGDSPSASVTMRVPVASFDAVIGQIRALKAEVVSQESSGRDVTATYADTEAQIASLKAARARFLTILSGARTIGETLTVQQRVDDVQGRIDRLEGQRRVLENQSDLATLTVTVGEKADAELTAKEPSGLSKAWDDAKDGFTSGVEAMIARSGRALLVLIVGVVAFFVLRLGWRLARRRLV